MRLAILQISLGMLLFVSCQGSGQDVDADEVAAIVIAMERAALDRWKQGDPGGFLEIIAEDYTYFDPSLNERVDGRDAITRIYEEIRGQVNFPRYQMVNPRVQVSGDVAVLTFNFKSFAPDSTGAEVETSHWHTTEVFRRHGIVWRLISTHWSYTASWLSRN